MPTIYSSQKMIKKEGVKIQKGPKNVLFHPSNIQLIKLFAVRIQSNLETSWNCAIPKIRFYFLFEKSLWKSPSSFLTWWPGARRTQVSKVNPNVLPESDPRLFSGSKTTCTSTRTERHFFSDPLVELSFCRWRYLLMVQKSGKLTSWGW